MSSLDIGERCPKCSCTVREDSDGCVSCGCDMDDDEDFPDDNDEEP